MNSYIIVSTLQDYNRLKSQGYRIAWVGEGKFAFYQKDYNT